MPTSCGQPDTDFGSPTATSFIADIGFASPEVGWAVGADAIWATTDGGATWTNQFSYPGDFTEIDVFDATHAWAVARDDEVLVATTDGVHWTALHEPPEAVDSVHFISAGMGFAVAGGVGGECGGVLLQTRDGGDSWQQIASPPNVQSACFSDASHGWLSAGVANHTDIFYSATGGRTWTDAFSPPLTSAALAQGIGIAASAQLECAQGDVWALYQGFGACASNQCSFFAYHGSYPGPWTQVFQEGYIDGQWLPSLPEEPEAPGGYPGPFSAVSATTAVFVGDDVVASPEPQASALLATDDGATRTALPAVSIITRPSGTAFLSTQLGWMVGETYVKGCSDQTGPICPWVIAVTTDGGRTWSKQFQVSP